MHKYKAFLLILFLSLLLTFNPHEKFVIYTGLLHFYLFIYGGGGEHNLILLQFRNRRAWTLAVSLQTQKAGRKISGASCPGKNIAKEIQI